MRPCEVFKTLEALRNSFSGTLSRKGEILSDLDTQTTLEAYQQWLSLMVDLEYLHPVHLLRHSRRLFTDLVKVDVLIVLGAMAELAYLIQINNCNGFEAHCALISRHLYNIIALDCQKMRDGDMYSRKRLLQLFSYLGRLSLHDIDLTQQCVDDYLASEREIPSEFDSRLTTSLRRILQRWMGPFLPYEIVPKHGPGAIAHVKNATLFDKYESLATDRHIRYSMGEDSWWLSGPIRWKLQRTSQTIFVPKSYKTFRTISMEPATLQYFQQGVWMVIDKCVRQHRYLRSRIDFHDAERNRLLAQRGSLSREYATIDLSAASDSVSYKLVKEVFRSTWLLRYIVTTRSTSTKLPDGSIIPLRKFAPMGSALCFPIETLLFAAVCEHVTRGFGIKGDYSVFGDDIIIPTRCVEELIQVLSSLGFRVNLKKSFTSADCDFRESCGGEFVDGFDVTPLRISRRYNSRDSSERFSSLISLANGAYDKSFLCLRLFFLKKMRDNKICPLFAPNSLKGANYTNFHLKKRWNNDYQRFEFRASSIVSKKCTDPALDVSLSQHGEDIRYRHWLESTYKRQSLEWGFQSHVGITSEYSSFQWFSAPDDGLGCPSDEEEASNQVFTDCSGK